MYVFTALGDQITDCRFLGNTAAGSGGAYWEWSNGTAISGSTFGGNKATAGGALYLDDQGSLITATAVYGNGATGDGGGINDGDGVYIKYTGDTISGNHASGDGGGINSRGAGVLFAGAILFHRHAGGIRNSTDSAQEYPSVSFNDSTISGNSAEGRGGGVYNQGSLDASRTEIIDNRAVGGGGGIYHGFVQGQGPSHSCPGGSASSRDRVNDTKGHGETARTFRSRRPAQTSHSHPRCGALRHQ